MSYYSVFKFNPFVMSPEPPEVPFGVRMSDNEKPVNGPFGNHTRRPLAEDPRYSPDPRPMQWHPGAPTGEPVPTKPHPWYPSGTPTTSTPSGPKKGK